jgi:hypothetical protein
MSSCRTRRIAVLADPSTISNRAQLASAARDLGVELLVFEVQNPAEIGGPLDAIAVEKLALKEIAHEPENTSIAEPAAEPADESASPRAAHDQLTAYPAVSSLRTARAKPTGGFREQAIGRDARTTSVPGRACSAAPVDSGGASRRL